MNYNNANELLPSTDAGGTYMYSYDANGNQTGRARGAIYRTLGSLIGKAVGIG